MKGDVAMYFNLKKKKIVPRVLSTLLFLSVFVTSIIIQTMQVKAYWMDDYEIKNKTYFVKIGDKVYFRKFGKNALPRDMWLHDYLEYPTGEKGSFIATYDTKTKKVSKAFNDDGSFFVYMNKRFYMQHKDTVYSVDKNGKKYKKLTNNGELVGGFNKKYIVVNKYKNNRSNIIKSIIYKDGKQDSELNVNEKDRFQMITDGRYAVYYDYTNKYGSEREIWCKDLKSKKAPVLLGTIKLWNLFEGADDCKLMLMKRKKSSIYFSMTLYTGWALDFSNCVFKADPEKKNSLKLLNKGIVLFDVDNKERVKDVDKNCISYDGEKIYFNDSNGKKKLITKDLSKLLGSAEKDKGKEGIYYYISTDKYIDGDLFMLINRQIANVEKDIGWKSAFDILERYYVRIPVKNPNGIQILYKDVFN